MLILSTFAATMLLSTASVAAEYATRDVGPWIVSASSDKQGCFLTRTYPSSRATTLLLSLDIDGNNRLTILNANWSIKKKQQLRLDFRLSDVSFPRHLAVGIAAEGKRGFVTSFDVTFPSKFAASQSLQIQRGDVPVEDLSLNGSGAAIAEMRKCVDRHRRMRVMGRSVDEDRSRIPIDPFAVEVTREPR